jgi:hypothetical protein
LRVQTRGLKGRRLWALGKIKLACDRRVEILEGVTMASPVGQERRPGLSSCRYVLGFCERMKPIKLMSCFTPWTSRRFRAIGDDPERAALPTTDDSEHGPS